MQRQEHMKEDATDLYFSAVYDTHPWRPDLGRCPVCEVVEIGAYSGAVKCLGQFNSGTGEGAVTADLVQCVSVGGVVTSVARQIQRLQLFTLCASNNHIVSPPSDYHSD